MKLHIAFNNHIEYVMTYKIFWILSEKVYYRIVHTMGLQYIQGCSCVWVLVYRKKKTGSIDIHGVFIRGGMGLY